MQLGEWQLDRVSGGNFKLDGGAMFGVVPKPLWNKLEPADDMNCIRMATNCLLARNAHHTVLIDTGTGNKHTPREREQMLIEPGDCLVDNLAALGVNVDQIDIVVLTHLHFDHAGGGTRLTEASRRVATFPRARDVVQRGEWETATSNMPELRGSYPPEHFQPLAESGQLELITGDVEIATGLHSLVTGGHTHNHQALVLSSADATALYAGDLCPMTAHIRSHWCMAYDVDVLRTRRFKPELLGRAADEGWWIYWDHDPDVVACRLARDERREFIPIDAISQ